MSRVGKKPIEVPNDVEVTLGDVEYGVKGPKGTLAVKAHPHVTVDREGNTLTLTVKDETNVKDKALWGLYNRLLQNAILGVTKGFEKKLEVNGVGYKVAVQGKVLKFEVGFSHEVLFDIPEEIDVVVEKNIITVTGIDKQQVGEVAARIRRVKKPEPYKGKGIKYVDEVIRRKAGKAAKAAA